MCPKFFPFFFVPKSLLRMIVTAQFLDNMYGYHLVTQLYDEVFLIREVLFYLPNVTQVLVKNQFQFMTSGFREYGFSTAPFSVSIV